MREGTIGLSNSEMAEWRRCPRKWYLHHYRRLKRKGEAPTGSAVSIGNLVHDSLAAYYDINAPVDPMEYAQSAFDIALAQHPSEEKELTAEFELVQAMLGGYLEWLAETGADADLVLHGSEHTVQVPLRNGLRGEPITLPNGATLTLLSKLDVLVERTSDDHRLALEHKTTGTLEAPLVGYRINSQFLTEHLARFLGYIEAGANEEDAYNECSGILLNLIKKSKRTSRAKPPFYKREEVTHNIHELRSHWKHVVAIAAQIADAENRLDAGEDHQTVCPPNAIPDRCKWECPFFNVCPMADDGSDFEGVLANVYEEADPLERYEESHEV